MTTHVENNLIAIENSLPVGSLSAYIAWINRFPLLTAEQEYTLAQQLKTTGDIEAARRLVMSHLRFVVSMTRRYLRYGFAHEDLIQEGTVGLMKAVKLFDPDKGVRLISFAVHWIKAAIHDFLIQNWRMVKVATTKAQRKLFFNQHRLLKREQPYATRLSDSDAKHIAADLSVSIKDVRTMEARLKHQDKSLDHITDTEDGGEIAGGGLSGLNKLQSSIDTLYLDTQSVSDPANQIAAHNEVSKGLSALQTALHQLKPRLREILEKRWLTEKKSTLHELAEHYNISAERVRQLEKQAFTLLKSMLLEDRT